MNYASDMDISVQSVALAISQISPCKTIKKEKPILSDDALAAILSAPPNTKFGVRDRAILILLYDTLSANAKREVRVPAIVRISTERAASSKAPQDVFPAMRSAIGSASFGSGNTKSAGD